MGRQHLQFCIAWILGSSLWFALLWLSAGSWQALAIQDPQRQWRDPRALGPIGALVKAPHTLLWMGDSVSIITGETDDKKGQSRSLVEIMEQAFKGEARFKGWAFKHLCRPGANGFLFERWAVELLGQTQRPALVIIPVNARSLNRRGRNGFIRPSELGPPPNEGVGSRSATIWRGALAESHRLLVTPFSPARLPASGRWPDNSLLGPGPARSSRPKDVLKMHYDWIYGDGFELDAEAKNAFLRAGQAFQSAGCQAMFYATPVERKQLRNMAKRGTLEALDAAVAETLATLRQGGFAVLDLHQEFEDGFVGLPSEHLNLQRRIELAEKLAPWIARQAKTDFSD